VNTKKWIVVAASIVLILIIGAVVSQPLLFKAVLAKYKSTDHFVILAEDSRIRYEIPAKESALALQDVLDGSQAKVALALKSQFKKPHRSVRLRLASIIQRLCIFVEKCEGRCVLGKAVFVSRSLSPG
jgi:hypothetical protein